MKMGAIKRPVSTNPALNEYLTSCKYAVMVFFWDAWTLKVLCRSLAEARVCLKRESSRSSWEHEIVKLEVSNGLSTQRRPL